MKNIVIVGAGFGGLQTALGLEKKFSARGGSASGGRDDKSIALTLIDKRDYHLFVPNLYEAATAEEELVSIAQVKKSLTLPMDEVLAGKNIKFIKGSVSNLDPVKKQLRVDNKQLGFDYLILALGSQSDFFNVEGAEANALVLKDLPNALRIRNQVDFIVQAHRMDVNKKTLRIVVAGGGYTGLELAAELKGLVDFVAWKNQYPREKVEIEIIEAGNKLVSGFDSRLSDDAYERFQELGIHVRLASRITKVDAHFIELASLEKVAYDCLIWTTGVKACSLHSEVEMVLDRKGRLPVNGFFQVEKYDNIFALGDFACVTGTNGQPVPSTAQDAWNQAKYLSYALPYLLKNQVPPKAYKNKKHGFIVSLGGKWAIADFDHFYIKGFIGYAINQLAHLRYYMSVVGLWKAIRYIIFQDEMYGRND